jgi:hypothetical protein
MMILWKRSGCPSSHSSIGTVGSLITENRANWLTILSSIDGGSKKSRKSWPASPDSASKSPSGSIVLPGLTLMEKGSAPSALPRVSKRESISTVKTSPWSRFDFRKSGKNSWAFLRLTAEIAASCSKDAKSEVAKCSAAYGA